jgi:Protein of unknown function (DUF2914)
MKRTAFIFVLALIVLTTTQLAWAETETPAAKESIATSIEGTKTSEAEASVATGIEEIGIYVLEASVATGIDDRVPIGVDERFPSDVGKVYGYSKIAGGQNGDHINHIWYYGDRIMAEVELDLKSSPFRTWSSKNILPTWTGKWRVEIIAGDGTLLKTLNFTIE